MAKLKYKISAKGAWSLFLRGKAVRKNGNVDILNDLSNFRNTGPEKTINVKKALLFKFRTYMSDITFDLNVEWTANKYEVGNPDTGKPDIIWEVNKLFVYPSKLVLPLGYDIRMSIKPSAAKNVGSGNVSKPQVVFKVDGGMGPMVGSWSKYPGYLTCDIVGRKIKYK